MGSPPFFRDIASAIKKLLDAVNDISAYIPGISGKQALEQRKREFVKYSKRFSNTLKEYFREGQCVSTFVLYKAASFAPDVKYFSATKRPSLGQTFFIHNSCHKHLCLLLACVINARWDHYPP
jgi:hypothetical protein